MVSQAELARQLGVSRQYVNQQVKAGVIPAKDGKIDPEAAKLALQRAADPDWAPVAAAHAARRAKARQSPTATIPGSQPRAPQPPIDPPMEEGRYAQGGPMQRARAADAVYRAKGRQLEYERAVGKLVESAEVVRALAEAGPALRQLDGIVDRIAARVAAESDVRKVRTILTAEIDACRQAIADFYLALAERLTARQQ